jgi:hypothetical protein
LVVVPPAVATTASTAVVGVKGVAFCTSGKIPSAAAVKDVVGSMSRRLREASQQLSQQLSQVELDFGVCCFMGIVVSCVSVRRPTSPTAWRRVP